MESLPFTGAHKLYRLVEPLSRHLLLHSVIEGKTWAHIFVDDREKPKTALLWVKGKLYLLGDPNGTVQNVENIVESEYMHFLQKYDASSFAVFHSDEWRKYLRKMFSSYSKQEHTRSYYELNVESSLCEPKAPEGVEVMPITKELLAGEYKNVDLVKEEMCSERYSVDDFLEKSYGYVAVIADKIVTWCMSEYNSDSRFEIGIATVEEYRRKGLAVLVAKELIQHGKNIGVKAVGWHCWRDNIPSVKTARKLGLKHITDYTIMYVKRV